MWAKPAKQSLDQLNAYMFRPGAEPYQALVELENLRDFYEVTKKDAKDFVDFYKKEIMKDLLGLIAGPFDYDISVYVKMLRRLGADWHELDIVERSIEQGHLREHDSDTWRKKFISDATHEILSAFKQNILTGINRMHVYGITVDEIPAAKAKIEQNKELLIKLLLTYIRHGDIDDCSTVKFIVTRLQNIGVDWHELDTILSAIKNMIRPRFD